MSDSTHRHVTRLWPDSVRLSTDQKLPHDAAERDRQTLLGHPKALSERRRQYHDHQHDHDGEDLAVAEDGASDRTQDAPRAVEQDARLALRQARLQQQVM